MLPLLYITVYPEAASNSAGTCTSAQKTGEGPEKYMVSYDFKAQVNKYSNFYTSFLSQGLVDSVVEHNSELNLACFLKLLFSFRNWIEVAIEN